MVSQVSSFSFEKKYIYRWVCELLLAVIVTVMFFWVWYRFAEKNNQTGHLLGYGNLLMSAGIYFALYIIIGRPLKAFRIGVDRKANLLASQVLTLFSVDALETLISCAITGQFRFFPAFLWRYVLLFFVQGLTACLLIIPMVDLYRHIFPALRILEIHKDASGHKREFMNDRPDKYHVAESISSDEGLDAIFKRTETGDFDAVLINDIPSEIKNDILKECFNRDIRVYFTPKISDIIGKNSEEINLFDTPLYLCRNNGIGMAQRVIKRTCDILFSLIGLVLTSPILVGTAIAIKSEDGGPVFFKQERTTIGGRTFMIIKFRSMIVDAEKDGRPHPAGDRDPRITKVGRVIRPTRIDELPQLINILKGEMSIVGPRPERVEHMRKYTGEIPEFVYRLKVKGGLTGPAQVFGKYNTDALNKLKMDLAYITNYSILLDLQILFETVKILAQKESTEGFSEEKQEEMHGE
ncbi:MAG: sugar transferase [Lachnospiraceae bacterium]|nr:sugar transferase [Lachnospiraceae bacterium]